MPQELNAINVVIADRTYRLKIDPADEETIRKQLKIINDKILDYRTNFAGKDMQDYVAMVLLWFATEVQKPLPEIQDMVVVAEQLTQLEQQLDKAITV
jgi:cell division protein ZapA